MSRYPFVKTESTVGTSESSDEEVTNVKPENDDDETSSESKSETSIRSLVDLGSGLFGHDADIPLTSFDSLSSIPDLTFDSWKSSPVDLDDTVLPLNIQSSSSDEDTAFHTLPLGQSISTSDTPSGNLPFLDKISDETLTPSRTPPAQEGGKSSSRSLTNINRFYSRSFSFPGTQTRSSVETKTENTPAGVHAGRINGYNQIHASYVPLAVLADESLQRNKGGVPIRKRRSLRPQKTQYNSTVLKGIAKDEPFDHRKPKTKEKEITTDNTDYSSFDFVNRQTTRSRPKTYEKLHVHLHSKPLDNYNIQHLLPIPNYAGDNANGYDDITFDNEVSRAFVESMKDGNMSHVLKKELQLKIQHERLCRGKPELVLETETPKVFELTDEEKLKRNRRLQQNRESAQRSRLAQRRKEDVLQERVKKQAKKQSKLQKKKTRLVNERDKLRHELDEHLAVCPMIKH